MKLNDEQKFLISLIFLSFFVRIVLVPLYVDPPDIPHDFYAYLDAGNTILKGGTLYVDLTSSGQPSKYGPLFALTMASWFAVFGESYTLMKIPSILFDLSTVIVIYYILKNLKGIVAAKYASIFYSFSYISLWSAGALGNDDSMFMFFMILAIYLVIKDVNSMSNIIFSSISLGLALGYKLTPIIILLPIIYLLYQCKKYKNIFLYIAGVISTIAIILFPFYLKAGFNVLFPYNIGKMMPVDGMSLLHLIKMLSYYLIYHAEIPYNTYQFPEWISTPFTLIGFTLVSLYILKFRLKNKDLELFRNIILFIFVGLIFSKTFYGLYVFWLLPFVLLLAAYTIDTDSLKNFSLSLYEIAGIILIISSTIIHAALYRWWIDYTTLERSLILIGTLIVPIGTYLTMIKTDFKIRISWSFVMFVAVAFTKINTRVLLLFGSIIPSIAIERLAWGYEYFAEIVLMLLAMLLLFRTVHIITQRTYLIQNLNCVLYVGIVYL